MARLASLVRQLSVRKLVVSMAVFGVQLIGVWLVRSGLEDLFGVGNVARVLFWCVMAVAVVLIKKFT